MGVLLKTGLSRNRDEANLSTIATAKRKTTKRVTKAMSRKRRGTGKRELVKNQAGDFFARRTRGGQFNETHELGRSLSRDRRTNAKRLRNRARVIAATAVVSRIVVGLPSAAPGPEQLAEVRDVAVGARTEEGEG
jgi:hypothetical protein